MTAAAIPFAVAVALAVIGGHTEATAEVGRCAFTSEPSQGHFWDPSCQLGMQGCLADGVNVQCRFCGGSFSVPCPAAGTSPTSAEPTTTAKASTATTSAPPTTAAATTTTVPPTTSSVTELPDTASTVPPITVTATTTTLPPTTTTVPRTTAGFLAPTTTVVPALPPTTTTQEQDSGEWVAGTWTTGYWDCCKPSCAWPGKGNVSKPAKSCDAKTGEVLWDANVESVCLGGTAAACTDQKPFLYSANVSMGFAAAAVSGHHGLTGDANCGQCFELKFVNRVHSNGNWGGAHEALVGRSMIVQVTNIGYDVTGDHSFDLQIPGAGQGAFASGCAAQFAGYSSGDFDCNNRYGGCSSKDGCARLPAALREACRWRYDWFHWLEGEGKTNNPYVNFRRVRCPEQLTSISGSIPADDDEVPAVVVDSYLHA